MHSTTAQPRATLLLNRSINTKLPEIQFDEPYNPNRMKALKTDQSKKESMKLYITTKCANARNIKLMK